MIAAVEGATVIKNPGFSCLASNFLQSVVSCWINML